MSSRLSMLSIVLSIYLWCSLTTAMDQAATATTLYTSTLTQAPYLPPELLIKRDVATCGNLKGAYSNVQAPICSGSLSVCTFSNGNQGCCDGSGSCQFYTTCNGYFAGSGCRGSGCLSCPQNVPFCIKYNFYDTIAKAGYDGYSCGTFDPGTTTIQGLAASIVGGVVVTSTESDSSATATSSSSASPSRNTGASTASSTQTGATTSSNTSSSSTSSSSTTSNTSSGADEPPPHSGLGRGAKIAIIVVVVVVVVVAAILAFFYCRRCCGGGGSSSEGQDPMPQQQVSQYP